MTTYGVIRKPGLVDSGAGYDALVRGVDGLYLTGDTTRARGIGVDKAARWASPPPRSSSAAGSSTSQDTVRC